MLLVGTCRRSVAPAASQDCGSPVIVMFVTTNGMANGIADPFAGKTIAQMRATIRNLGFSIHRGVPAFLDGKYIQRSSERRISLKPGNELWLGWKPPDKG